MSYLNNLNSEQKKAVLHTSGPILIIAGAGAGKTKTITHRIVNLIKSGVNPENILAVTFTNKAASEMRERVNHILQNDPDLKIPIEFLERPTIKTFHSLGVMLLKENFNLVNLPKNFTILDKSDSKKIIKDILILQGIDPKVHDPAKIVGIISKQKSKMISPVEYSDTIHKNEYSKSIISEAWIQYEKHLSKIGGLDFDDLLIHSTNLLIKNSEIREKYQNRFKYIHIDEYQDTNDVQYEMTKILAEKHQNICVVGDADQNIYSWRGASIKNIMNFEKDYQNVTQIILEENYRSTQNILTAANQIISKNKIRKEKKLFTKNNEGEKIFLYKALDEYDEANFVVSKAKELINSGTNPEQICVLYRANFQSRVLEEVCLKYNLPHQIVGTKFFDRKEIKDVIAYIKSAINEKDFTNLNRIINTPARGIGKATILKIQTNQEHTLTPAVTKKIKDFRNLLQEIKNSTEKNKPSEIISMIFTKAGFEKELSQDGETGQERIQNIKELVSLAKKYDIFEPKIAIEKFLEDVSLASDQDELEKNNAGIKLMTVHASKGLEFEHVFVTGLEAGLFPMERENEKEEDSEEERRLFYVAITRAKKRLYLSWANFRTIFGNKNINISSEFLDDIDSKIIETENYFGEQNGEGGQKIEYLIDF
ncbi:MAG TPA: UvrD-helicase domain-containing protein [Candidatus Paceibacterota bacterium]|nr:UvrD-helicase domain-containing protein [Candidatus Paceibacterota bacterium]HMP19005.1 UvrD-helicase domain-containing protein [Candidatus Paceibacterota bacterium]HMP85380.1 UvrD-helicase domain-containing protein [Candidatus Paceibacterota bacterium]